jgi:hypothetical protein
VAVTGAGDQDWIAHEEPLGRAAVTGLLRLLARARASWPLWLALAVLVSLGVTVTRARRPAIHEAVVVLRFSEGKGLAAEEPITIGELRAYIADLALSRPNLLQIARKYPKVFPDVEKDPDAIATTIRDATRVTVVGNEFVTEHTWSDPPRVARIEIAYKGADPVNATDLARDLAQAVRDTETARQKRELERRNAFGKRLATGDGAPLPQERTVGAERGARDPAGSDAARAPSGADAAGAAPPSGASKVHKELWFARQQAAAAQLALDALDQQQYLRFDLVDPGAVPTADSGRSARVAQFFLYLALLLPVAALLFGAFDPRVLDLADLATAGVAPLGRVSRPRSRV